MFSKWSHEKRADILTNEEPNTTNEEPDADISAADSDQIVLLLVLGKKMIGWLHCIMIFGILVL